MFETYPYVGLVESLKLEGRKNSCYIMGKSFGEVVSLGLVLIVNGVNFV